MDLSELIYFELINLEAIEFIFSLINWYIHQLALDDGFKAYSTESRVGPISHYDLQHIQKHTGYLLSNSTLGFYKIVF